MDSKSHSPATSLRKLSPDTHCTGGRVGLKGWKNLAATGIQPLDRTAHSELLYRIFCRGPPVCLDPFYYYPPTDAYLFQVTSSVRISLSKTCMIFSSFPMHPSHLPLFSMSLILLIK